MARDRHSREDPDVTNVCVNRRARHDYAIDETFEAGLVLVGTEVKSLRAGTVQLKDAHGVVEAGEVLLVGCHISPYDKGHVFNHDPERTRKLLLNRREIRRISNRVLERGYTLIPLRIYFRRHLAKVEIALARGKAQRDRRDAIKRRDLARELARER
ncbi:MAG: SsrA-binding protein SmpB [Deltaproteobacteria bacterium]|nr:SsrA-binding protein SmpB [Deltaproteobacteria bacterium]